jgi:hypothetical protein
MPSKSRVAFGKEKRNKRWVEEFLAMFAEAVPVASQELLLLNVINDAHLDYNHLISSMECESPLLIMILTPRRYGTVF